MRTLSIAILVAMAMMGLLAMTMAEVAEVNGNNGLSCEYGQSYLCNKRNVPRCGCRNGKHWSYSKRCCVESSCTHSNSGRSKSKSKSEKRCNSKCVKGTWKKCEKFGGNHNGPAGYGGNYNGNYKKDRCEDKCECDKGWYGSKCNKKKVEITFSKDTGKNCGKATECTKTVEIRCKCKKNKSRSHNKSRSYNKSSRKHKRSRHHSKSNYSNGW